MPKLHVTKIAEKKIRAGVQLLTLQDVIGDNLPTGMVQVLTQTGQELSLAYLSPQNKGIGWVLPDAPTQLDQAYFHALFEAARTKRSIYETSAVTTAYRLFNQDGDNFGGLSIDRYGDYAVFSIYNQQVATWLPLITVAFQQTYPELLGAYAKWRFQGAEAESTHLYGQKAPETFVVLENGVSYSVFLNEGLMTGIFLDQHEIRGRLVDGLAAGKHLLNLFSYTAAFSVAAALGGAKATTSVDLAKRSRELSQAHFLANGLEMTNHQLVVMDVFDYFRYAKRHKLTYEVIVIDPPSFARNKRQTFSVAKDYHKLVAQALDILSPEGILIASTNASNVSLAHFQKQVLKGLGETKYELLHLDQLPGDFASNPADETSNYLKVMTIKRLA